MLWKVPFKRKRYPSIWHELLDFLRLGTHSLSIGAFLAGLLVPISLYSRALLSCQLILIISLTCLGNRRFFRLITISIIGVVSLYFAGWHYREISQNADSRITIIPASTKPTHFFDAIIPEEDGIYLAFRILSLLGGMSHQEYDGTQEALLFEYERMRSQYGSFPSPLLSSFLGLQNAEHSYLLQFPAPANTEAQGKKTALIFLHGLGGNWSLLCEIMSETVAPLGVSTFCPTTSPLGNWSSESGAKILANTLDHLERLGFKEVYLAGISAGSVGTITLAPRFKDRLKGLILISGIAPGLARANLETLLITGENDERFTVEIVRSVLKMQDTRNLLQHHWISGDHLAIVKEKTVIQSLIRDWIKKKSLN